MESNTAIILLFASAIYFVTNYKNQHNNDDVIKAEYEKIYLELQKELHEKAKLLNSILEKQQNLENKYNDIKNNKTFLKPPSIDPVTERDRRVINDPLYPMINRTDRPTFDYLIRHPTFHGIPTRYRNQDTYRPIAVAKINNDFYNLMGRRSNPNSSKGDYYLSSLDKHKNIKIPLVDDRNNPLIKDFDNIPETLDINYGILNGSTLEIQELKNADLTSGYI